MRNFILWIALPVVRVRFTRAFQKKIISLSFFSLLYCIYGYAQISPNDKIDPAFRFAMAQPKPAGRQSLPNFSPAFKTTPGKVSVAAGQPAEERYDCIIYTTDVTTLRNDGVLVNSVLPNFVTAWVTLEQMEQLSKLPVVHYIAAPTMDQLHNDIAVASSGASLLHQGILNNTVYKGKGVIVAIFDTGIDWKHPDFRDENDTTQSRILRIWDQTLNPVAGEVSPSGMGYGVEYTQAQINDELDGTPANFVRESDINGHGTHVAGTAAGNGAAIPATHKYMGMAPEADIVVVKGGNGSFSTTNIINALTYLKNLSASLGKPIVLNMSLGGQFGAHDGTRDYEVAVDNFTASAPGRAVVISAGNDNGTNIHNQLSITNGGTGTVSFTIPAVTTGTDIFQYRVYVNDNSNISATFSAPGGGGSVTAIAGQSTSGSVLGSGFNVYVSNQIEAGNGDRYVDVYIMRNGSNTVSPAGVWTLTLTNNTTNTLTLDGWVYYINSAFVTATLSGGNSDYLVGSPGNATTAITVASFVARPSWYTYAANTGYYYSTSRMDYISTFSSHGPRRDGVIKPEIAATGQQVISALSSASSPATADIIIPGKYRNNQGTSMSAPVVTGAVALMLQINPQATVTQLRTSLFSNTSKDALTEAPGATPNATWGYGRLDVYKAASSFNCSTADRRTYQYDASNFTQGDNAINYTVTRVAVRFTPDMNGKMAGAYFHPHVAKTALVMELRTNNAGIPGALLGTVHLPDTAVAAYSWNYVDLSNLNISVTSGTDYFVIVYRDASSSATWSMRRENTSVDNRSLVSTDGVSWTNPGYDYKIRSVVYSNPQLTNSLAASSTVITRNIATTNLFIDSSCRLIAQVTPSGTSAVSGAVTANVWIEPGVPVYGDTPFVARHYQVTPAVNATSATGRVTLYFTQDEFDAFNAHANSMLNLPTSPTDDAGKANVRVAKYEGASSDGSGLPAAYSGSVTIIDPADSDIVWNFEASRWEVSFNTTGFGGFIVQTSQTPLQLLVDRFSGYTQGGINILNWTIKCQNKALAFDIERSAHGTDFSSIGNATDANGCNQVQAFNDNLPLIGASYYRIKITTNGSVYYTKVILLQNEKAQQTSFNPNVIKKGQSIRVICAESETVLRIFDATGRQVYRQTLVTGLQNITPQLPGGMYIYRIQNNKGIKMTGKLVVQ